jgi:hypothetical protein
VQSISVLKYSLINYPGKGKGVSLYIRTESIVYSSDKGEEREKRDILRITLIIIKSDGGRGGSHIKPSRRLLERTGAFVGNQIYLNRICFQAHREGRTI